LRNGGNLQERDVTERLRSGEYREQTQKRHLVERIDDLPRLPRVGHILEMVQKNGD
jgi:hypothetical protein